MQYKFGVHRINGIHRLVRITETFIKCAAHESKCTNMLPQMFHKPYTRKQKKKKMEGWLNTSLKCKKTRDELLTTCKLKVICQHLMLHLPPEPSLLFYYLKLNSDIGH